MRISSRPFHGRSGTRSASPTRTRKDAVLSEIPWPRLPGRPCASRKSRSVEEVCEWSASRSQGRARVRYSRADIAAILIEPSGRGRRQPFSWRISASLAQVGRRARRPAHLRRSADGRRPHRHLVGPPATWRVPDIICFAKKMQVGGFWCPRAWTTSTACSRCRAASAAPGEAHSSTWCGRPHSRDHRRRRAAFDATSGAWSCKQVWQRQRSLPRVLRNVRVEA